MNLKAEGGMLEFVSDYGKLIIFGIMITILIIMIAISIIDSNPEWGMTLSPVFGGGSSTAGTGGG